MTPLLDGNEDPRTVLVAREIEAISDVDIVGWAGLHVASPSYADDDDYIELVRCNPRNALGLGKTHGHLKSLVARRFPDFDDSSVEAGEMARKLFLRRIRRYLQGEIRPFQICLMVSPIEQKYDSPHWLGGLFDACDWMDERTTLEQALHLRDAIEQILSDNGEHQPYGVVE
ncbi:hypothetical protein EN745_24585 [Mesorhizobium sp. M4A.F.Ca.ET.022.05.2.1]|uniref:hypothetical protein n=1 Tax=Mesorhizobium sp. M4A.F.Ca.ET.022.05.2.1 TaxID=2496653 RepID=UPI000FCA217D|nr:hypothetical protein [Mesorhizobium sp. M4A.F.Ca.ET.022.05.2.1]RVC76482.1 hypothetical protein EN745_24585 [Mesorhizobium sp. M4A.F.Ca.ET.022.05.2.1]